MSNYAIVNNVSHQDVKIDTEFSAQYGNNVGSVYTIATEFSDIQKEYPILFQKEAETDQYRAVVLLGLQNDENLFIKKGEWAADYIPAMVVREPFSIGYNNNDVAEERTAMIHIDMDNPRVNTAKGQPLFLELGGNSPYLERIASTLKVINNGIAINDVMFDAFNRFDLIEPVKLEITLKNGQKCNVKGKYTISREKLANLSGADLEELNRSGFLQGAFLVMSSLDNIYKLINKKNSLLD